MTAQSEDTRIEAMCRAANERGISDELLFIICDAMVRAAKDEKQYVSPTELIRSIGEAAEEMAPGEGEDLLASLGVHSSLDVGRIFAVMTEVGISQHAEGEDISSYMGLSFFPESDTAQLVETATRLSR